MMNHGGGASFRVEQLRAKEERARHTCTHGGNNSWFLIGLPNSSYLEMCVPTKAGYSTTVKLLQFAAGNMWNHMARGTIGRTACATPADGEVAKASKRAYLVVRNPYERLLSAFLGQVAAPLLGVDYDHSAKANLRLRFGPSGTRSARYGDFNSTPEGFGDFVRQLTSRPLASPDNDSPMSGFNFKSYANDLLAPISRSARSCLRPEYRWHLPWREYYTVLKLEHQADWYARWVAENHLARWTQSNRWASGCFWRAPNATCSETLQTEMDARGETRSEDKRKCQAAGHHNGGACTKMRKYYTDDLAARVTAYAAEDLKVFEYPVWRPSEQAAPDAGPPLQQMDERAPAACSCHGSIYQ